VVFEESVNQGILSMTNNGFTEQFCSQITNLKNSYLLSFAIVHLVSQDDAVSILEKGSFTVGAYSFKFSNITNLVKKSKLSGNNDLEIMTWEYLMFSARILFINQYEAFKDDKARYSRVKDSDWFVFLANIRHSLAHGIDAVWDIKDYGKKEIFYLRKCDGSKLILDKKWDKMPMKFDQIGGWETVLDLVLFVEGEVKENSSESVKC